LHKQLDEIKPNAIFASTVKRAYEEQSTPDQKRATGVIHST